MRRDLIVSFDCSFSFGCHCNLLGHSKNHRNVASFHLAHSPALFPKSGRQVLLPQVWQHETSVKFSRISSLPVWKKVVPAMWELSSDGWSMMPQIIPAFPFSCCINTNTFIDVRAAQIISEHSLNIIEYSPLRKFIHQYAFHDVPYGVARVCLDLQFAASWWLKTSKRGGITSQPKLSSYVEPN